MRKFLCLLLVIGLLASAGCATQPFDYFGTNVKPTVPTKYQAKVADFGGFIGTCSSDQNFPYYWECMSENSGGEDGDGDGDGGDGSD
jgi:hypothetical protein